MNELEKAFLSTFSDKIFSKAEKKALVQLMEQLKPDQHTLAWLRSRLFMWVRGQLKDHQSEQALNWLEEANKVLNYASAPEIPDRVYFSPGDACLQAILQVLQKAKHTIHICVFTISDDRISSQIIACHQMGTQIQIITDNEKLYDTGSDIRRLSDAGIPVRIDRSSNHMHHKFAITDHTTAITGSYNWTRSAANYNHENILVTANKSVANVFEREFDRLWQQMDPFSD